VIVDDGAAAAPTRRVLTARAIRVAALAPVIVLGASMLILGQGGRSGPAGVALLGLVVVVLGGLTTERVRQLDVEPAPLLPAVIGTLGVLVGVAAVSLSAVLDGPPGPSPSVWSSWRRPSPSRSDNASRWWASPSPDGWSRC
jgi:hypothetical protein